MEIQERLVAHMANTQVFKRYEKKYMLDRPTANALVAEMKPFIRPDEYGRYSICSLYYDTEDFACYRAGKTNPQFKQKLRLRSYGVPRQDSPVYLELKKKLDGITYKRRVACTLEEAYNYIYGGVRPQGCSPQTLGEIDWFKEQNRLVPQTVLCYDRLAFAGIDQPSLRITFDTNVRWRADKLRLEAGDWGSGLLPMGSVLLEIKTGDALPLWLAQRLSALEVWPTHFSKYNHVVQELMVKESQSYAG